MLNKISENLSDTLKEWRKDCKDPETGQGLVNVRTTVQDEYIKKMTMCLVNTSTET